MYTMIERRKANQARAQETGQQAQRDFLPKLQQASGFVGFYLVEDKEDGVNTAIIVWESKAQADAFQPEADSWTRTLDAHGHRLETSNRGETIIQVTPQQ